VRHRGIPPQVLRRDTSNTVAGGSDHKNDEEMGRRGDRVIGSQKNVEMRIAG